MTLSFIPMIASILLIKNPYFEEQGLESVSDVIASSACFGGNHASFFKKKNWSDMVMFDFGSNDIPVSSVHLKDALESDCSND